ncbi:hypothetical protein EKO27_g4167 [Xylaria grammica]|uniref:Uncharacterized protein n=1 Tax=Xylaria grammica TaxID=363999 RepID=A0A439D954_9PEZI|nr:hypothetical protein EKO27_g4167 [Xylaria grammica]
MAASLPELGDIEPSKARAFMSESPPSIVSDVTIHKTFRDPFSLEATNPTRHARPTTQLMQNFQAWLKAGESRKAIRGGWHGDLPSTLESSSDGTYQTSIFSSVPAKNRSTDGDDDDAFHTISTVPLSPGQTLPCEFVGLGLCDRVFHPTDVDNWIEHIVVDHLDGKVPAKCVCWFCDDFDFDSDRCHDRMMNFESRMWHIRDHILEDGFTVHDIRPDYHLIDHANRNLLISELTYNSTQRYSEIHRPGHVRPFDFTPPEDERPDGLSNTIITYEATKERTRRRPRSRRCVIKTDREKSRTKNIQKTYVLNPCPTTETGPPFAPQPNTYEEDHSKAHIPAGDVANEIHVTASEKHNHSPNLVAPTVGSEIQPFTYRQSDSSNSLNSKPYTVPAYNDSLLSLSYRNNAPGVGARTPTDTTANSVGKKPKITNPIANKATQKRCGQPLYIDVQPGEREAAVAYAQAASGLADPVTVSGTASGTSTGQASTSISSPTTPSAAGVSNTAASGPVDTQSSNNVFVPPALAKGMPKFLLLCVNTGEYEIKLEHIDLTNVALDVALFSLIRETYEAMRGPRLLKNIFMAPKTIEYVKVSWITRYPFELVRRSNTGECVGNYERNSIPGQSEVANMQYTFSPCPPRVGTLPIQPHIFMHSFLNPGDHLGDSCLVQLPKKVGRRLKCVTQPRDPFDIPYGWGIYIVEGLNTLLVSLLLICVVALVTLTVLLWSALKSDVQGGTGIGQYALAVMAAILAIAALFLEPLRGLAW